MTDTTGRSAIEAVVLEHVRSAADDIPFVAKRRYKLAGSGITADLAIAGDELIGMLIRGADDTLDGLERELAVCRRYFDSVVVVVAPCHVDAASACDRRGAALWTVSGTNLIEYISGDRNVVAPAALIQLISPDARARLVRPLIPRGGVYDRSNTLAAH